MFILNQIKALQEIKFLHLTVYIIDHNTLMKNMYTWTYYKIEFNYKAYTVLYIFIFFFMAFIKFSG